MIISDKAHESEFASYHPLVSFVYFAVVIGIAVFSMNPVFLLMTFFSAVIYSIDLYGVNSIKTTALQLLPILIFMTLINPLFNHRGVTVMFYLNGNAITLEALIYGLAASVMFASVLTWFRCASFIFTPDKLIYLFGKVMPVLSLMCSMALRFVPLLMKRYHAVSMGMQCLGKTEKTNLIGKIRLEIQKLSVLISWSLEASIETSASMESRGYGLKGRTCFNLYSFKKRDVTMLLVICILFFVTLIGIKNGLNTALYYPSVSIPNILPWEIFILLAYGSLLTLPLIINLKGELEWKQYYSRM